MQTVLEKLPAVAFLLSEQKIDTAVLYRKASFCVFTEFEGESIAYNSLTGELIKLDDKEKELLSDKKISCSDDIHQLIKSYFLVPIENDDIKLCDGVNIFAKTAAKALKAYHNFTIFPTTDCNARCFYCYESGIACKYMDEETAKGTVDFITRMCAGEKVELTWYGGEPLMNTSAIDIISSGLESNGIDFTAKLATNGSLLDESIVMKAKKRWHIDKVQITLDGTKDVYNRIKAYSDGREDAFSEVLSNIDILLCAGIKVNIRINADKHNVSDIHLLADVLGARFAGRKGLNVYTALLFDCEGAKRPSSSNEDRADVARELIAIEDKLSELCVLHPRKLRRSLAYCYCKADSPDSIVITADGRLVKCDFYTDSHFVGDIFNLIDAKGLASEENSFSKRVDGYTYCKGCKAYPICLRVKNCPTSGNEPCDFARRYLTEERLVRSVRYAYAKEMKK